MPTVRLLPSGRHVEVSRGTRLTDAIRLAGLPIASTCGDGLICAKCAVRVVAGPTTAEAPVERDAKLRNRIAAHYRLACAIRVQDDLTVTADYWGSAAGTALVLIDHGSRRPEAHTQLEWTAARLRERRPDLRVHVAHLELAEPSLAAVVAQCVAAGEQQVDVFPMFLIPGRHLTHDLPEQVRRAQEQYPGVRVRLLGPLGERPEIADLILAALDVADPETRG